MGYVSYKPVSCIKTCIKGNTDTESSNVCNVIISRCHFLSSPHKWHTMLLSTALFQPSILKLFTMYAFTTIHGITSHYKGMCIIYLSICFVFYCKRIVVQRQLDVIHYNQASKHQLLTLFWCCFLYLRSKCPRHFSIIMLY